MSHENEIRLSETKGLEEYIPRVYGVFYHVIGKGEIAYLTYVCEHYITLSDVSQLSFKRDHKGQIKELVQLLGVKLKEGKPVSS